MFLLYLRFIKLSYPYSISERFSTVLVPKRQNTKKDTDAGGHPAKQEIPGGRPPSNGTPYGIFFESGFTTDFERVTLLVQFKRFDWLIVARFPSRHFSRLNEWLTFIPSQKDPEITSFRFTACRRKAPLLALCSDHKHSLHLIPFLNATTFFYSVAQKRFTPQ